MSEIENDSLNEQSALGLIARLINNYEEHFEIKSSFTAGVFGFSDPKYPAVRLEWFQNLERNGIIQKRIPALESLFEDMWADTEGGWQEIQPADSRINWRVTVQHDDYYIHVMAVDKNFKRFAFSLQTKRAFEAGLCSDQPRPDCSRYEVVDQISDLKPIFDEVYVIFKRCTEKHQHQEDIDRAVAAERDKWKKQISDHATALIVFLFCIIIAILASNFTTQIDFIEIILGSGIFAVFGTFLLLLPIISLGRKIGLFKDVPHKPWLFWPAWVILPLLWAIIAFMALNNIF